MSDDKKNIGPEVETPAEAPAPEQPVPDKLGPVVGNPTPAEKVEPSVPESHGAAAPEAPAPDKEAQQTAIPGMDGPVPAFPGKVVDFAAAREGAARNEAPNQQAAKPRRDRPPKEDKGEKPAKGKTKAPRDKMSQSKGAASQASPAPAEAPAAAEPTPEQPPVSRDTARSAEPEQTCLLTSPSSMRSKSSVWRPGRYRDAGIGGVGQGQRRKPARAGTPL